MNESSKVESAVSQKRVKLHLFEPSHRKIWTVVGRSKEHWLDPENDYCSCPSYYFGALKGKNYCYHLESLRIARKENQFEVISFSDEEYGNVITGIIHDL